MRVNLDTTSVSELFTLKPPVSLQAVVLALAFGLPVQSDQADPLAFGCAAEF